MKITPTFDSRPRGYTTHERWDGKPCPGGFACGCSTSIEPHLRALSIADYQALETVLAGLTKAQLSEFIASAGGFPSGTREEMRTHAFVLQYRAWWPPRTVQR